MPVFMESLSTFAVTCCIQKASPPRASVDNLISSLSSSFKPLWKEWKHFPMRIEVPNIIKTASVKLLDSFVETTFNLVEQPLFTEGNFAPVSEIGEAVLLSEIEGKIPEDFPQGVYIRTGSNPLYPNQTASVSAFGTTAYLWVEGDGMLHATYFRKDSEGKWGISYKNRYVESETFLMEKQRNKSLFIPAAGGQPAATLAAFALNMMRFGKAVKDINNTNVFEHAGRVYTISESHLPYEINILNLETLKAWNVNGAWDRPFTSHPKRVPGTGELVMMGCDINKPYYVLGVISADGQRMLHKVDLKFKEATLIHELGVTINYNIILDYPLRFGIDRLLANKSFIGYDYDAESRIGVMPRFGDTESISWFKVKNNCTFHIINSFEEGNEIIVRGCRTTGSVIPGPDHKADKAQFYRRAYTQPNENMEGFDPSIDGVLFSRPYEWRLNMETGEVKEGHLTRKETAMDFPAINNRFTGCRNKYAYTQVVDSVVTSELGAGKYKMFAKLYFDELEKDNNNMIKVEYHTLEENHYCSGLQFVEKKGGTEEDEGWLICYVHDEKANVSKVYIVDAKKFTEAPVAKITIPQRVPYGFHGIFVCD